MLEYAFVWYLLAIAAHALPEPRPTERWYGAAYKAVQLASANLDRFQSARMRRQKETHKRLMVLAYASIVTAAVARIPGLFPLGPLAFFAVSFLFVIAGAVLLGAAWFSVLAARSHSLVTRSNACGSR